MNNDERLKKIQEKQAQLKAQEQLIRAKINQTERKARTKRLIELGAAFEAAYKKKVTRDKLPKLQAYIESQESRGQWISKALGDCDEDGNQS